MFAARPREGLLPRLVALHTDNRGQTEPGQVAGRVAVRAPRPCRIPEAADHAERMSARRHLHAPFARQSHGKYEQLGKALGPLVVQALTSAGGTTTVRV